MKMTMPNLDWRTVMGVSWIVSWMVQSCLGLQITSVKFPSVVFSGDTVHLSCRYKLEGDTLYSLTWWKDDKQFYKYGPALDPPEKEYIVPGIVVNMAASGLQDVVLAHVDQRASGSIRCEVVSEQSFEKDSKGGNLTVIDQPARASPSITGRTVAHHVGELLLLNCSSPPSHPPAELTWLINGRQAADTETVIKYPGHDDGHGRTGSSTGLQMFLRPSHFIKGVLVIGCSASVLHLKEQISEKIIMDSDYPVEAPKSQFSEGRSHGLSIVGSEHPLLLLLLVLSWRLGT